MKSMETGRQDGGSDKNHAPFSVGKTGNISRKFLTIILKIFDKNFERLQREKPYKENSVKVVSKSVMYADAGRVAYVYYDKISGYVKTIKEPEFTGIQKMIITAMGLEIACEEAPVPMPIAAAEEAVIPLELLETCKEVKDCHKMLSEMVSMEVNVKELKTKNIRLEAERDVYRELFMMANGTKGENNGSENKSEK